MSVQDIDEMLKEPSGAVISSCGLFRYLLWRRWDFAKKSLAHFHLLNPSKADASVNDPTLNRGIGFAMSWDCGGVIFTNLLPFRATEPRDMMRAADPFGENNDLWTYEAAKRSAFSVAAWGACGGYKDANLKALAQTINWKCLGVTRAGHPKHPLYLKASTPLQAFP